MKLREPTTDPTGAELTESDAESIRITRLTPAPERPVAADPPGLRFVTDPPRSALAGLRPALGVLAGMILVLVVVIAIVSQSSGTATHRVRTPASKLTPAQLRLADAQRARAAAIAKAKRDRGTDAELQDTIPAVTPAPSQ
jgi:hypothetical protein